MGFFTFIGFILACAYFLYVGLRHGVRARGFLVMFAAALIDLASAQDPHILVWGIGGVVFVWGLGLGLRALTGLPILESTR